MKVPPLSNISTYKPFSSTCCLGRQTVITNKLETSHGNSQRLLRERCPFWLGNTLDAFICIKLGKAQLFELCLDTLPSWDALHRRWTNLLAFHQKWMGFVWLFDWLCIVDTGHKALSQNMKHLWQLCLPSTLLVTSYTFKNGELKLCSFVKMV